MGQSVRIGRAGGSAAAVARATGRAQSPLGLAEGLGVDLPGGAGAPQTGDPEPASAQAGKGARPAPILRALTAILPCDRVLILGAAEGLLATAIARHRVPASVMAFEADPALLARARATCLLNGQPERLHLRAGMVCPGLTAPPRGRGALSARSEDAPCTGPVACHEGLRRTYLHNVIVLHADPAAPRFLRAANLSGVRLVLLAPQPGLLSREDRITCRRALRRAGCELDLDLSAPEVEVFRRVRA